MTAELTAAAIIREVVASFIYPVSTAIYTIGKSCICGAGTASAQIYGDARHVHQVAGGRGQVYIECEPRVRPLTPPPFVQGVLVPLPFTGLKLVADKLGATKLGAPLEAVVKLYIF